MIKMWKKSFLYLLNVSIVYTDQDITNVTLPVEVLMTVEINSGIIFTMLSRIYSHLVHNPEPVTYATNLSPISITGGTLIFPNESMYSNSTNRKIRFALDTYA